MWCRSPQRPGGHVRSEPRGELRPASRPGWPTGFRRGRPCRVGAQRRRKRAPGSRRAARGVPWPTMAAAAGDMTRAAIAGCQMLVQPDLDDGGRGAVDGRLLPVPGGEQRQRLAEPRVDRREGRAGARCRAGPRGRRHRSVAPASPPHGPVRLSAKHGVDALNAAGVGPFEADAQCLRRIALRQVHLVGGRHPAARAGFSMPGRLVLVEEAPLHS